MAETIIENRICTTCSVEARPGDLFCYNCGSSTAQEVKSGEVWHRGENVEKKTKEKSEITDNGKKINFNEDAENIIEIDKISDNKKFSKPIIEPKTKPKLESASALRKKSKFPTTRKVEVIWKERQEDAPNILFVVVASVLVLLAAGMMILALYLK